MPLWSSNSSEAGAPKFTTEASTGQTGQQEFGTSVYGYDITTSKEARTLGKGSISPGYVKVVNVGARKRYETLVALKITGGTVGEGPPPPFTAEDYFAEDYTVT